MARKYIVEGGSNLEGEITIRGAKNAVTKEMVASLLAPGVTRLRNVPDIGDVDITRRVMESLGCKITHDAEAGTLESDTSSLATPEVPAEYSGLNRIPILMAGPLLHRFGRAVIPMMGGCGIGERPLDFHLQGFQSLGAKAEYRDGAYHFNADKLTGTRITLPFPSVGATENLMMAATMARGTTEIRNAAIEPEIVDLALLLQAMGAGTPVRYLMLTPFAVTHLFYLWQPVTYLFLHGGFFHILFNMLTLLDLPLHTPHQHNSEKHHQH